MLLIPYDTAISLGATTRSVAAGLSGAAPPSATSSTGNDNSAANGALRGENELQALMQRAALGIFGATPDKDGKAAVEVVFFGRKHELRRFRIARDSDCNRGNDYRQHDAGFGFRAHARNRHLLLDWIGADSRRGAVHCRGDCLRGSGLDFRAIWWRKLSPKSQRQPTRFPISLSIIRRLQRSLRR